MDSVTIQPSVGEFRHSLTSCCGDCTLCCIGFLCPNCLAFCAAQSAGEGMLSSVCNCLLYPFCLCCLRSTVREKRAIDGSCCGDLMTTLCCPCCGYIQIKREFSD